MKTKMASSSAGVDPQLKKNIEDQLERLMSQLEDVEGLKDELSEEEYSSMKQASNTSHTHMRCGSVLSTPCQHTRAQRPQECRMSSDASGLCAEQDTLTQLTEFQESLKQMTAGNMTLQSEFEAARQAVTAAISQAFKTPEVIRLFAKKEPAALRRRLADIDRDVKLGKIQFEEVSAQAAEILIALKKLGEKLEAKEEAFLAQNKTASMADFEAVSDGGDVGAAAAASVTK